MAKTQKMIHCGKCGKEIEQSAKVCPGCGKKRSFYEQSPLMFWVGIVITCLGLLSFCHDAKQASSETSSSQVSENKKESTLNSLEVEKAYKAECKVYSYKEILRRPSQYKGTKARVRGAVIQEQTDGNIVAINIAVIENDNYVGNMWVLYTRKDKEEVRFLEEDVVTVWGELDDLMKYETTEGAERTVPKIQMAYYKIAE